MTSSEPRNSGQGGWDLAGKVLSVVAALLVVATAWLGYRAAAISQERTEANQEAEALGSRVADLEQEVARLSQTNDDLRADVTSPEAETQPRETENGPDLEVPKVRSTVFLTDLEPMQSAQQDRAGTETIAGVRYPASYTFEFTNCSSCTYEAKYQLHKNFDRFTATVGLTEESRADDVIDGLLEFSVYVDETRVFGPQVLTHGETANVDVPTVDGAVLRLSVAEGTNFEAACWCSAQLHPANG